MKRKEFYIFPNSLFVDLHVIQFGHEFCNPSHTFGPTLTHNYLLHYVVSGKGVFFPSNHETGVQLTAGQVFLMPPNAVCSYAADKEDPWRYYWIEFNGLQAKSAIKRAGFTPHQLVYSARDNSPHNQILNIFSDIIKSTSEDVFFVTGKLYQLLHEIIQSSKFKIDNKKNDITNLYLRVALDFIKENYQYNISIEDIANHCNLNRNYFTRLFKDELEITPSQFLIRYRLNIAADLLKNSDWSISDISNHIGYANQFNFSSAFKKHYQVSPFDWRNLNT